MSLRDTRDIGTAKIVMLGGGGGGSYTAGSGISISNSVITNIRKGALTGVIDSVSSNIAHTQITGARDTFAAGALILLQSEAAGTANNLRIQYGAQSSDSQTFAIYDTSSTAASVTIASGDTVIMMIDNTGYRAIILNVLSASGGSSYAGLGIGKKKTVTNNIIDTDIDLHRAPIVGDRLLIYFDATVQNPTGLTTYNNGTAVTSGLESVTPMYINAGWNILKYESNLLNTGWVRVQNVPVPDTLAGMSDTLIVSPSDGQMLVYENNMWKNKTAVQANPTGTAVRELKKIQIGDNVFDTFGLKTYDVSSVTSGVNGAISVDVITASQLNGEIIAIHTGSNSGTTGNAWTLALSDSQTVEALTMSKADGTAFTEALTANSLMFVKVNTSNDTAVVLGIVGAGSNVSANGSGSPASYLNKLKIGSAVYDTSAIRPFSVSQIANNTVKIYVADIDQLDGKVIALSTGALTGTTSSAWSLNLVDTSGGAVSLDVAMLNADGTAFSDDISAHELLFVAIDLTNYEGVILSVVGKSEDEIKTATGNPITLTDAIAGNAIEVSAEIVATQDLHGYDKPWVGGAGKNKLSSAMELGSIDGAGNPYSNNNAMRSANFISVTAGTEYTYSQKSASGEIWVHYYLNGTFVSRVNVGENVRSATFTVPSGVNQIKMRCNLAASGVLIGENQLEIGSQATSYEPYTNICPISGFSTVTITDVDSESHTATVTVSLGSTVYGGTLDLTSGELTVDKGIQTVTSSNSGYVRNNIYIATALFTGAKSYANNEYPDGVMSNVTVGAKFGDMYGGAEGFTTLADGTGALAIKGISNRDEFNTFASSNTIQLVFPLATPTTTTLTAAQLALVKGYNQLSCNSGDMEITYKASGLDALKERVDELEDAVEDLTADVASKTENSVVGTVENGTTASQPYAVGEHFIRNDKFCTCISAIASGATLTQGTNYVEGTIAEAIENRLSGVWSTLAEGTLNWSASVNINVITFTSAQIASMKSAKIVMFELWSESSPMVGYSCSGKILSPYLLSLTSDTWYTLIKGEISSINQIALNMNIGNDTSIWRLVFQTTSTAPTGTIKARFSVMK